jgi:glycosyltransferase involved in cell wall biosynthesis
MTGTASETASRGEEMASHGPIRVAFGSIPKDGGTFTFYRNVRPALRELGIDLRCVSTGRADARLWEEEFADEGCHLLAPRSLDLKTQARAFSDWCDAEEIDIAMGINSAAILSSIPHLPARMRIMARCANAFDHGYRITMSGRDRLMRVVALSPRLRDDLVAGYGADPERMVLIPNGIDPARFEAAAARPRGTGHALEIGFLGRLEHGQKGVLHIPAIADALVAKDVPFKLRIAGKGRDGSELERRLAAHIAAGRVSFAGALSPKAVPQFLGESDIYLFTSRFEGMPNALLEAMMAGAVPACFNIAGITDYMIEDGRTGLLREQEDAEGLAHAIAGLNGNRPALDAMRRAVAAEARVRFTHARTAAAYADLFREMMATEPPNPEPLPWSQFVPDPNFPQTWRRFVPPAVKSLARKVTS